MLLAPAEESLLAGLRVGDRGTVGDGRLDLGRMTLRVSRWWDPSVPRRRGAVDDDALVRLASALPALPDEVVGPAAVLGEVLVEEAAGPGTGAGLAGAVDALVGLGPGLTPAGDDVLVGVLAVHRSADPGLTGMLPLPEAVHARTGALSAALLEQAVQGAVLPQVVGLLSALDRAPSGAEGADGWRPALRALLAVGGSSGTAMAHGILLGLRAERSARRRAGAA